MLFMGDIQCNALTIYICFMLVCILTFLALSDGGGSRIFEFLNIVHCLGKNDTNIFFELQKLNNFHDFVTYFR